MPNDLFCAKSNTDTEAAYQRLKVLLLSCSALSSPSAVIPSIRSFLLRSYEPTPKPKEELKFALLDDAKTQKYVPVRQTPAYQPTTPR